MLGEKHSGMSAFSKEKGFINPVCQWEKWKSVGGEKKKKGACKAQKEKNIQ